MAGSGKSTALRCIDRLESIDQGEIVVCGHRVSDQGTDLRRLRQDVGIVFQSYNLFPHLTVEQNITLAPRWVKKTDRKTARELARKVLAQVGLEEKISAYPEQLSGGQQQRVAIARSLAMQPQVMLFDEVTSALDPELVGGILQILRDLSARRSMTMIIVTHQMKFAERSSDRTLFFDEGNIVEDAESPVLFSQPKEARTRQFLDSVIEGQ
ncbi:hypothetical protein G6F40_014662 [Rhizopus arrhizus]|nr:hypothetical protein G6F40_014662 [Rhizopus arrhizus]